MKKHYPIELVKGEFKLGAEKTSHEINPTSNPVGLVLAGGGVTVKRLEVTENGAYTAPTGEAYSPVVVNVAGGGGDSRFSTCEVEVFYTLNGQPLTLDTARVYVFNEYTASPVTGDPQQIQYSSTAIIVPDKKTVKPLLFEGVAYISGVMGQDSNNKYYAWNSDVTPAITGDISIEIIEGGPMVVVRGSGTITFEMVED